MWAFTSHICEFQRLYIGRNNGHHSILLLADPIWFKAWSVYQFTCWGCHILDLMQSGAISFTSTWCASSHNSAIGVLQATIRQSTNFQLYLFAVFNPHICFETSGKIFVACPAGEICSSFLAAILSLSCSNSLSTENVWFSTTGSALKNLLSVERLTWSISILLLFLQNVS